jgi:hypothetical protein
VSKTKYRKLKFNPELKFNLSLSPLLANSYILTLLLSLLTNNDKPKTINHKIKLTHMIQADL